MSSIQFQLHQQEKTQNLEKLSRTEGLPLPEQISQDVEELLEEDMGASEVHTAESKAPDRPDGHSRCGGDHPINRFTWRLMKARGTLSEEMLYKERVVDEYFKSRVLNAGERNDRFRDLE
ncbi:hypothetical protein QR680_017759 [Steinernema hermaphroditum]|uniref:Uncharacterized protein n=1 Tax=Steinernema hermaphroditum TaxID=289476 RepID=A0AA39HGC8_9BILA|nr:hypothetical protein QR680_017759 [Steinernema hermaphroditum]